MSEKLWQVTRSDKNLAFEIAQKHGLNPFTALIAVSRGLIESTDINNFFSDSHEMLSNPFDLPDMDKAVDRINKAIEGFEKIAIFGDYDADGVCATALVYSYLEEHGANVFYYIPDRYTEGYGLTIDAVDKLNELGAKVIITVDNGIRCIKESIYAKQLGIDLVITDHHRIGNELPDAVAVINPHRADCRLKFKELAGVGVAFKLICAIENGSQEDMLFDYSDIVAIGTIGDVVPLIGENRTIVKKGLISVNENPRAGLWALREVAGYNENKPLDARGIAFIITPRINAAGRIGSAKRAVELLLCEDDETAQSIAQDIDQANTRRKSIEQDILEQVEKQLNNNPTKKYDRVIVCDGEGWHHGVIGIVAARIVEKYGKPCIIISREGALAKGSGRSIEGFSLFNAVESCSDILEMFGGHPLAAGLSLKCENIDAFRDRINKYDSDIEMPFPIQKIDLKINPKAIDLQILNELAAFEPFGAGNTQPVFGLFNMTVKEIKPVSNGKHIRLLVSREGIDIPAMYFGMCPEIFPFCSGDTVDLAVVLERNEYLNKVSVSVYIKNVRYSNIQNESIFSGVRIYEKFKRNETLSREEAQRAFPDRELIVAVYKAVKSKKSWNYGITALCHRIGDNGEKYCAACIALDVLEELRLLIRDENGISLPPENTKANLEDSLILKSVRSYI
jgi:single-stranded-DNA-specific exonuclease